MGGDCSQKLLPRRGTHSSLGRSKRPAQCKINTLSQRPTPGPKPVSLVFFFPRRGGAVVPAALDPFFRNQFVFSRTSCLSQAPSASSIFLWLAVRHLGRWEPPRSEV